MVGHNKLKIVLTGNCQARPLANLLASHPQVEITDVIILHLSREDQKQAHQEAIHAADVIVAQCTDDGFKPSHLRSSALRASGKAIIWPNIFFGGQQPFLRYFTHATAGRLLGPLEAMHDLRIFSEWHNANDGVSPTFESDANIDVSRIRDLGLKNLIRREAGCDVIVSDLIEHYANEPIFYTFNHPSKRLLKKLAERLLERLGYSAVVKEPLEEPLSAYTAPSTWMRSDREQEFRGREVRLENNSRVSLGPFRHYTWMELRQAFFYCYQHYAHLLDINKIRVTPNYPGQNLDGPFSC